MSAATSAHDGVLLDLGLESVARCEASVSASSEFRVVGRQPEVIICPHVVHVKRVCRQLRLSESRLWVNLPQT